MQNQKIRNLLHKIGPYDRALGRVEDFERADFDAAYNECCSLFRFTKRTDVLSKAQLWQIVEAFAVEQERLTGRVHNRITQGGCRTIISAVFNKPSVLTFVIDKNPAVEFFQHMIPERRRRATFDEYGAFIGAK